MTPGGACLRSGDQDLGAGAVVLPSANSLPGQVLRCARDCVCALQWARFERNGAAAPAPLPCQTHDFLRSWRVPPQEARPRSPGPTPLGPIYHDQLPSWNLGTRCTFPGRFGAGSKGDLAPCRRTIKVRQTIKMPPEGTLLRPRGGRNAGESLKRKPSTLPRQ